MIWQLKQQKTAWVNKTSQQGDQADAQNEEGEEARFEAQNLIKNRGVASLRSSWQVAKKTKKISSEKLCFSEGPQNFTSTRTYNIFTTVRLL